ncbi:CRISPR-associated ring nuclease Csm6 [Shewanella baltica]|uniref:CRISPR-associated ring nuclease Csm6 n=1 Tax=Shewanella baltica TaxID=62322 RepID=UPI003D790695
MKNILLATIGASPQVLTETLYAIHQSGKPFPDEVFVITTLSAKPLLTNGLFRDGHMQALINEYQMPDFTFDESHIWLIEDELGNPVDDAKSIEDQSYMADFITRTLFKLTRDPKVALHTSLAGGRKTMAFYTGYAMSLLGREQDTLSHVFVDDNYEFVRDFWYPTKAEKWVAGKNGQGEVDISKAQVTLAEIPFVRMRTSIDPSLLSSMENLSFSQTVALLNAGKSQTLTVKLNPTAKTLETLGVEIKLTAKELAFYLWLHQKGEVGLLVDRYFEDTPEHSLSFLTQFSTLSQDPRVFESFGITPEDFKEQNFSNIKGMEKVFLQPVCSQINRKLRKALPVAAADKLAVLSITEISGQRYHLALCSQGQLDDTALLIGKQQ